MELHQATDTMERWAASWRNAARMGVTSSAQAGESAEAVRAVLDELQAARDRAEAAERLLAETLSAYADIERRIGVARLPESIRVEMGQARRNAFFKAARSGLATDDPAGCVGVAVHRGRAHLFVTKEAFNVWLDQPENKHHSFVAWIDGAEVHRGSFAKREEQPQ